MNTAARLIVGAKKQDHIKARAAGTPSLASRLAVRPVQAVCWHTKHCVDRHCRRSPTSVDQSQPSVADRNSDSLLVATLLSPPVTHFGTRAFAVAGPKAGNQLPMHIRARDTVSLFKMALKTYLHSVDQVQIVQECRALVMIASCYVVLVITIIINQIHASWLEPVLREVERGGEEEGLRRNLAHLLLCKSPCSFNLEPMARHNKPLPPCKNGTH